MLGLIKKLDELLDRDGKIDRKELRDKIEALKTTVVEAFENERATMSSQLENLTKTTGLALKLGISALDNQNTAVSMSRSQESGKEIIYSEIQDLIGKLKALGSLPADISLEYAVFNVSPESKEFLAYSPAILRETAEKMKNDIVAAESFKVQQKQLERGIEGPEQDMDLSMKQKIVRSITPGM
ncbi:MAG: hypothetical protein DDT19_00662 [Syntrophomonadaceae bacterium]|nr:hypothetical protein [Bacillota bacterium]